MPIKMENISCSFGFSQQVYIRSGTIQNVRKVVLNCQWKSLKLLDLQHFDSVLKVSRL